MSSYDRISQFLGLPLSVSLIQGKVSEDHTEKILDIIKSDLGVWLEDIMICADFDLEAYEDTLKFCSVAPFGSVKLVIINLTGSTTKSQQALSFVLENPLRNVKFILFSETKLLPALVSRCQVLSVYNQFIPEQENKTKVLKALASASLGEKKMLKDVLNSWKPEDTETLKIWAFECVSKRYEIYSREEIECLGLGRDFAMTLLEAIETLRGADYKRTVTTLLMAQIASTNGAL